MKRDETADGSNYRETDDPGTEVADGSNYRDEPEDEDGEERSARKGEVPAPSEQQRDESRGGAQRP